MRAMLPSTGAMMLACALHCGAALASHPTLTECLEGSDFIGNAALARDAGMTGERFIERMRSDFTTIHAFPQQLRWFAHDADDEVFLTDAARVVFDQPAPPEAHRQAFLRSCLSAWPMCPPRRPRSLRPATPSPEATRRPRLRLESRGSREHGGARCQGRSSIAHTPKPPAVQIEMSPRPAPRSSSSRASVPTMRVPVAANGWPSATLLPTGLSLLRSMLPSASRPSLVLQ